MVELTGKSTFCLSRVKKKPCELCEQCEHQKENPVKSMVLGVPTTVLSDDWRCEQIERKEYLEWCRDCAVRPKGMFGIRQNVPDNRKVVFDGIEYYPQGYLLSFDENGSVVHTAVLHDLKTNAIVYCSLDKVNKRGKE